MIYKARCCTAGFYIRRDIMKKFIKTSAILVVIGVCMYLLFAGKNINTDKKTNFLKNTDIQFNENEIMAVAFLGGLENYYDYSALEKYFTVNEFETFNFGGQEKYFIVPRYDNKISLSKITYTDDDIETESFATVKGCFYITCNESDIMSNVMISTEHNGEIYEFSPYLSGKDGSLVLPEYVKELK